VNQAKVIEELLNQKLLPRNHHEIQSHHNDLYQRIDDMNSEYVDLVKRFKQLEKENSGLQKLIDELMAGCEIMDREFQVLHK
jgi:predicted nuclease with TOPRIM domain